MTKEVCGDYPGAVPWLADTEDDESDQDTAERLAESAGCDGYTVEGHYYCSAPEHLRGGDSGRRKEQATEFDQVKAMFERAGIAFEIVEDHGAHQIIWEGQTGPNNRGDYGEEAELDFSTDGSLLYAGAWAKLLARARRQWRTDRS